MKKGYRLCALLSTLMGYVGAVFVIGVFNANRGWFDLVFAIFACMLCAVLNSLLWGGYFLERWYAKKRSLKTWEVSSWFVIPGVILNLLIICGGIFGTVLCAIEALNLY